MSHDTVCVTTQAEWNAAAPTAAAIDVLPGPHQIALNLHGRDPSPRIHVAGDARVTTIGPITLACAGRIIVNDGAIVELIPHGRAHVTGGTVHARAGTVVHATGGVIDCESGCTVFTPHRGQRSLRVTMAPGVMWWDGDGAALLTRSHHTTEVTGDTIHYHPTRSGAPTVPGTPSALEATLHNAVKDHTGPVLPGGTTVAFTPGEIIVRGGHRG